MKEPRGTQDFLPPVSERFARLERAATEIFETAGYRRIITPMFEDTALFTRGLGEATDVVRKEMYTFDDKSGNSLTLRPEGTAPVVRAIVTHELWKKQPLPLKLYYAAPMFRYERPQKGRFRQHHQLGIEAIGSEDPSIDGEVIETGMRALAAAGAGAITLLLNSMGHPGCRAQYLPRLREFLAGHREQLDEDCKRRMEQNPLRVFDCKVADDQRILEKAPRLDEFLCADCRAHFSEVRAYLDDAKISYEPAPRLVRGFDYYTRTTFEYQSSALDAAQNALGGGGRYDGLVKELGGDDLPGIGFGLGVERILLAQESAGVSKRYALDCYVAAITPDEYAAIARITRDLRAAGLRADRETATRKVGDAIKRAERLEARFIAIVGPKERETSSATLRDLETRDEHLVPQTQLAARILEKVQR